MERKQQEEVPHVGERGYADMGVSTPVPQLHHEGGRPVLSELLGFTAEHVRHLTGISDRQLRYWDQTEFFTPTYVDENRRRPFSRVYSFRDVVGLRAISVLRNRHKVPLQELRKVGDWLKRHHDSPWAELTFYVSGRRVFFDDPETGVRMAGRPLGQTALTIAMERLATEMREAAERLRERDPKQIGKVSRYRYVAHNAPVLAGTRIRTAAVWTFRRAGYSDDSIIKEYPRLTPKDVRAAIRFEQQRGRKRAG